MTPKPASTKQTERKPILPIPSRKITRPDNLEGGEETEIAAQISLPHESGWGWIVVAASFFSIFILDGVVYTFGSLIKNITEELQLSESLIALVNSIAVALYFIAGPFVSAFINRFGFRACIMSGSVICSMSLFITYFAKNYVSVCIFYGGFAGLGYSFINMSSALVVGFYFEKLRAIALSITTTGSSFGIMAMFPINTYLVSLGGWRNTTLLHSGMFGLIYFLGMTFKPLLSLTVTQATDDPTRTVTYLPNLSGVLLKTTPSRIKTEGLKPTTTERLFKAVSNLNFPTAAAVVEEGATTSSQAGPSKAAASRLTITANNPIGSISRRQLKQVKSLMAPEEAINIIDVKIPIEHPKKRKCWEKLCSWEPHVPESRPMYRDDAFYDGNVKKLQAYQKSVMDTNRISDPQTDIDYQLAVSRAAAASDLQERRGVFTTSVRRVLASMMDPKLLKLVSFLCLCGNGFFIYMGLLVPYVYLQNRNKMEGVDPELCSLFISAIGLSNALGRIILGILACKINPLILYTVTSAIAGISTILSGLSYTVHYQYFYCFVFGFSIAGLACLRSMIIVDLYGLDTLTNATGMMLMFQGIGSLMSTPLGALLKGSFGYSAAFYAAGVFMLLSSFMLMPIKMLSVRERRQKLKRENQNNIIDNKKVNAQIKLPTSEENV